MPGSTKERQKCSRADGPLSPSRRRNLDQQRHRASGLSLVIAAIVIGNTTYLQRAAKAVHSRHRGVDDQMLRFLSPLGREHINLSGDHLWPALSKLRTGKLRPSEGIRVPSVHFFPFFVITPWGGRKLSQLQEFDFIHLLTES